jgi:hypothetical protein
MFLQKSLKHFNGESQNFKPRISFSTIFNLQVNQILYKKLYFKKPTQTGH